MSKFTDFADLMMIAIRSLDEDVTLTPAEVADARQFFINLKNDAPNHPDLPEATALLGVVIRSLEGQVIFPKEAMEVKNWLSSVLAVPLEKTLALYGLKTELAAAGLNQADIESTLRRAAEHSVEDMDRASNAFKARLKAAGLDLEALKRELAVAMNTGDRIKSQEVMQKIKNGLKAHEGSNFSLRIF